MDPTKCLGSPIHRRTMLHVGFLGGIGLTLDQFFRLQKASAADTTPVKKGPKAESVIHIFLPGGMAHQESLRSRRSGRPGRVSRRRWRHIRTKLDGVYLLREPEGDRPRSPTRSPSSARLTHGEAAHERGTHNMFTGYRPSPALKFPSMGSVVSHELGVRNNLPPYVARAKPDHALSTGQRLPGLERVRRRSASAATRPTAASRVQDLQLPGGVTPQRFTDSPQTMLDAVNAHFSGKEKSDNLDAMDTFYQRAYGLISSSEKARAAFDINAETCREAPRHLRPQRRRPAVADGSPARGSRRAVRHAHLRRLGPPRRHRSAAEPGRQTAGSSTRHTPLLIRDLTDRGLARTARS